ncbi:MAG: PAS domain S-box protein [bacterium]|nr:PAS domain S-box protein [bacterium]
MMSHESFTSHQLRTESLFLELISRIVPQMPETPGLPTRLEILAKVVADLSELAGAMVVAFDGEGLPICYQVSGLSFAKGVEPFAELIQLRTRCLAATRAGNGWTAVPSAIITAPDAGSFVARVLAGEDKKSGVGMLLAGIRPHNDLEGPGPTALVRALDHLRWAVQDALHFERLQLLADLQQLATDELGKKQLAIDPEKIAVRLKTLFHVEVVTIVVHEQHKLYLSATTDSEFRKRSRVFHPDRGLIGFIFRKRSSLRLHNANDPKELPKVQPEKYHELEGLAKRKAPYRLLTVAMRFGDTAVGVIRALRRVDQAPFSMEEEEALQRFADLLGSLISASWRLSLYRQMTDASREAICISRHRRRKDPTFVYVSPIAEKLFGLTSEQLIGHAASDLYADKGEYERIRITLNRAVENDEKGLGPLTSRIIGPSGEIRSVDISYRLMTSPFIRPPIHYTIAMMLESQETEQYQRLLDLLDEKGLAYFLADQRGRTIESAGAERRLTGYSPMELLSKDRKVLYADPVDRGKLLARVNKNNGELVNTIERFRRKDGDAFFMEGVVQLLTDEEGRWIGYQGLYEDVTERIRLQGFLGADTAEILEERELLEKLRDNAEFHLNFTTSFSHQLRVPLGAMIHNLLNFKEGIANGDSRFAHRLEYLIGQVSVCSLLLQNLAFMDKILRGESFKFEPVNLKKLAVETKLNFIHLLPEKRLTIQVDDASIESLRKNVEIWGHSSLLRQVMVNLVDNAIKYSRDGTEIMIRGFFAGPKEGRAFEVSNRGIRISQKDRAQVFARGYRSKQAAALVPDGTGLGLWLVKKIAEAHGAKVRCTEVSDNGEERTTFQIFFPHQAVHRSRNTGGSDEVQA